MRFAEPLYLLLLAPIALGLWFSYRHVHGMARARKRIAFALRALMAALIVIALAGPELRRPNDGIAVFYVLDRSDSIASSEVSRARAFIDSGLDRLGPNDVAGVVSVGKVSLIDSSPGGRRKLDANLAKLDASGTDLAGGMRLAAAAFPEGKARRLVVLSDGNETDGDAQAAAEVLRQSGVQVDVVPLGTSSDDRGEALVSTVEAPAEARAESPVDIRVTIESTVTQSAEVVLDRDGVAIKRQSVALQPGRNSVLFQDKLTSAGFHRYRATLYPSSDRDNRNNVGAGFVAVRGKPKVLVLQDRPERTELSRALRTAGIDLVLGGPESIPGQPETLQAFDAVIFNDLNASNVTERQMKLIQSAVRDSGVGFAMVGGENSFLPGGYYGSPIAEILAVDLDIRQRKTFPSTTILIMVDASGSMGAIEDGFPKIRLAAKAAEETVKLMSPMDRVGVAGSSDGIEFVAPIQPLTDKSAVIGQIRRLDVTGGGIYIQPTLLKAEEALSKETTQVRHLILMADGNDSTHQDGAMNTVLRMRASQVTTSVVSIGDGTDTAFLRSLAMAGGGRYYLAKKASQLPAIFAQDASIMSRSAIEEGAFRPKITAFDPIIRGIEATPPLMAYCISETRPLSRVPMRTGKDDPLLAVWQAGLGTSLAFTSDAQARWARDWVGWDGFSTFWGQAVRGVLRRATENTYQVTTRAEGSRAELEVRAFDRLGTPLQIADAKVRVAGPDGIAKEVPVLQEAPGVYRGRFDASRMGSYLISVAEPGAGGTSRVNTTGFSVPYPAEYRLTRPNLPLLEKVAEVTDGAVLKEPGEVLRPVPDKLATVAPVWPWFLWAGVLLLPLDVAVRRLAIPFAEMWAALLARLRRRPAVAHAPITERLGAARERAKATRQKGAARPTIPASEAPSPPPLPRDKVRVPAPSPAAARAAPAENPPATDGDPQTTADALLAARRRRNRVD